MIKYTDMVNVTLDGKHVGVIKPADGGYAYFPAGDNHGGTRYDTVAEVKLSLED